MITLNMIYVRPGAIHSDIATIKNITASVHEWNIIEFNNNIFAVGNSQCPMFISFFLCWSIHKSLFSFTYVSNKEKDVFLSGP